MGRPPGCNCACIRTYNFLKLDANSGVTIWKRAIPHNPAEFDPDFPYFTGWAREVRTLSDGSFVVQTMRYFHKTFYEAGDIDWTAHTSVGYNADLQHVSVWLGETITPSGDGLVCLLRAFRPGLTCSPAGLQGRLQPAHCCPNGAYFRANGASETLVLDVVTKRFETGKDVLTALESPTMFPPHAATDTNDSHSGQTNRMIQSTA